MSALAPAAVRVADLGEAASARMEPAHRDYVDGGAGDERTLRANAFAFEQARLLPRVLRGTGPRDLATTVAGTALSMPVLLAPTAFHRLAHPDGETVTAAAAAAAGTVMVVSMAATRTVEDVAAAFATAAATAAGQAAGQAAGGLWFQLYPQPDTAFTASLVHRAEDAGCRGLVVTVDSPVLGRRERDLRNGFLDLPPGLACENLRDPATGLVRSIEMDDRLDWDAVARLREVTRMPLVLKGVLHPEDARLAVECGADGVWVSNHGGRQLDGAVATLDALPGVVEAVAGRAAVIVDGGVRRGTDALVALALGADAVAVGRPAVWGLAAGGEAGVRAVLELLRDELDTACALTGLRRPAEATPDLVVASRPAYGSSLRGGPRYGRAHDGGAVR